MSGRRSATRWLLVTTLTIPGPAVVRAEPGVAPTPLAEIVVTADRIPQPRQDVAASVTIVDETALETTPALAVDDILRDVPGFQLFRRQSSLVAHPTAQGVSLRGLGASGASRTLVLLDGVPLNDPFGGWVPWSRVPPELLERVEVVRGAPATAWGNYAMGGVIQLVSRKPEARAAEGMLEGGNHDTIHGSAWVADRRAPLALSLLASGLTTGGWDVVREDQRGAIDVPADSRHGVVDARLRWAPGAALGGHLHANLFTEERGNGTPFTGNDTQALDLDGAVHRRTAGGGLLTLSAYGKLTRFASRFSAVADDRDGEKPAVDQFDVPSSSGGAAATWSRPLGPRLAVAAGVDGLGLDGETHEDAVYQNGRFTRRRDAGARQAFAGGWLQATMRPSPRLQVTTGVRLDGWWTFDGFRREQELGSGAVLSREDLPARDALVADPSLGMRWSLLERDDLGLALRGAAYRGFRAPTVNELVRGFRVGSDVTAPNGSLRPERLGGGEIGADLWGPGWLATATGYWNVVDDPIANVTVGRGPGDVAPCGFVPGGGVCRQRQNLGRLRARGVELEAEWTPRPPLRLEASGFFTDSRIVDAPAEPRLEGKRVAQVPRLQGRVGLRWDPATGPVAGVGLRYEGQQYEDDLNQRSLGGYAVLDLFLGWRVGRLEAFVGMENALDRTIPVGRSADGLVTTGMPLFVHGGLRARL